MGGPGRCSPPPPTAPAAQGAWREFQGIWTATGDRHVIGLGGDRRASVATFSGTRLLSGASRPGAGFRAETGVLNGSATGLAGGAVMTDERGDQVFTPTR